MQVQPVAYNLRLELHQSDFYIDSVHGCTYAPDSKLGTYTHSFWSDMLSDTVLVSSIWM